MMHLAKFAAGYYPYCTTCGWRSPVPFKRKRNAQGVAGDHRSMCAGPKYSPLERLTVEGRIAEI